MKQNPDDKFVVVGMSTFHRNHKVRIKIDTDSKFLLKQGQRDNAKNIVEYNLDNYRKELIEGKFPLMHINHDFLIKQREKTNNIYKNIGYQFRSYNSILNTIDEYMKPLDKNLYIASLTHNEHTYGNTKKRNRNRQRVKELLGAISEVDKSIYAYKEPWLAVLASVPDVKTHVSKGFIGDTPFVEEKHEGAFDYLDRYCYLYTTDKEPFYPITWYKLSTNDESVNINNTVKVNSVLDYLQENGVELITYKN
jgi:hypothetical protein